MYIKIFDKFGMLTSKCKIFTVHIYFQNDKNIGENRIFYLKPDFRHKICFV